LNGKGKLYRGLFKAKPRDIFKASHFLGEWVGGRNGGSLVNRNQVYLGEWGNSKIRPVII
jgi:hypothetical protein